MPSVDTLLMLGPVQAFHVSAPACLLQCKYVELKTLNLLQFQGMTECIKLLTFLENTVDVVHVQA